MSNNTAHPAVVLLSLAMLACSSPASPEVGQDVAVPLPLPAAASEITTGVLGFTNAERKKGGVAPMTASSRLERAAQLHAEQIAQFGRLDHVLPNAAHPRPEDRLAAAGYRWEAYAENVAFGQRTPAEVVAGWMQSRGHRENIMNPTYTEMGAGYARDRNGRGYWVQVFGKPL